MVFTKKNKLILKPNVKEDNKKIVKVKIDIKRK